MLRVFRGKKLIIVQQRALLTVRCREQITAAGATVVGPVSSVRTVLQALQSGDVDAAIIDVEVDDETMVHLATLLDAMKLPFVFASAAKANWHGYILSGERLHLRKIADALFGSPGPSSTLH
ncbi:hypothetical protein CFBP7129_27755 (plasmid) [Agrobacterium tumefaciens]|uniref:Uncharacterized protein n=1 Tax=Agrobacterium tumefaciens TaxID=358 RepID=A0A4D7YNJ3_AGRTU|nr:hypothetical protein CFBP7129_27755 [Agrobacterium tumefaciens]